MKCHLNVQAKYLLTVIYNLYHVVRPGSSLSVWLYLITEKSKEQQQTVLLFPPVFITKTVWHKTARLYDLGLADHRTQAQFMTSRCLLFDGDFMPPFTWQKDNGLEGS